MVLGKQYQMDLSLVDFVLSNPRKKAFLVNGYASQLHRDMERIVGIFLGRGIDFVYRVDGFGGRITLSNDSSIYFRCPDEYLRGHAASRVQVRDVRQDDVDTLIRPMLIGTKGELEIL